MGRIAVLDKNMVNMIAAGEVVERPASVVKELLENSIDAGATQITVSVEDGGRRLISVTDNGCGMDAEDVGRAFEPHSTSKVRTSSDLQTISTLGFRGEALASIASVAQIRAVSRTEDSPGANCVEIDCGDKSPASPCSGDVGTTIQVRDIFYKLPARHKFLRTANTEMGHITEQFTRIALGTYPAREHESDAAAGRSPGLTLIHNNKEVYRLPSEMSLRERIARLFPGLSDTVSQEFVEVSSDEKGLCVYALLGTPNISRTSGKFQYAFLNGRYIRDRFISHAIKEAYRGCLEPDRSPVVFLFIEMPREYYDVNVHPTKIEVRFYNANLVHSVILGVLREALLGENLQTRARMRSTGPISQPISATAGPPSKGIADAMAEFFRRHRPVQTQQQFSQRPSGSAPPATSAADGRTAYAEADIGSARRRFLQIHDSYIIEQTDDGFIIIDQHALHERLMYEQLHRRISCGKLESQRLLMPESFEVSEVQAEAIKTNGAIFEKLGVELAPFGPGIYAVQSFPSLLAKAPPAEFVRDMIDLLTEKGPRLDPERLLDEVLNMAACKAAIKAGQRLSDSEIEQLLADSEKAELVSRCPHGRPTIIRFSISDLEKQFKRT